MEAGSGCTGSSESEVMSAQSTSSIYCGLYCGSGTFLHNFGCITLIYVGVW